MTLSERITKQAYRNKLNSELPFDCKEYFNFLQKHDDFTKKLGKQIQSAISNGMQPSSEATSALMDLIANAERLASAMRGRYSSGLILDMSARIISLQEAYNLAYNSFKVTGVSNTSGFSTRVLYDSFIVPKGRSLSQIALDKYGSRSAVTTILEDNPELLGKTQREIEFSTIKIRNNAKPVPAITASEGDGSWGVDMENSISLNLDGDINMLSPKDSLLQGVINIILNPLGSVPEDTTCGNYIVSNLGEDEYSINQAVAIKMLLSSIQQDDAVDSAQVTKFKKEGDAIKVAISIKPVHSDETLDLII